MADEAVLAQVLEGAVPALPRRAAQELTRFVRCGSIHDVCRSMDQTSRWGEVPIGNAQYHRGRTTSIQIMIERFFFGASPQFTARPAFKLAHSLPR
jgi:hypothetical protein